MEYKTDKGRERIAAQRLLTRPKAKMGLDKSVMSCYTVMEVARK